jgi:hypothetical protein
MRVMEKRLYQQSKLTVKNVVTQKLSGGCFKQEVLMNQQLNFIVAQNVITLGAITPEC